MVEKTNRRFVEVTIQVKVTFTRTIINWQKDKTGFNLVMENLLFFISRIHIGFYNFITQLY